VHAGVNKSIRIYRFADLIERHSRVVELRYPVLEFSSRCKLSCASYNSYIQHRLAVSDFEGTVQVRDTQHNVDIACFDEHSDRVWSIHCAPLHPGRLVTASMDASVRLWDTSLDASVAAIECGAQVQGFRHSFAASTASSLSCV
jgi:WD40 repeat protein